MIIAFGAFLTSCGNYNYSRSGKIRKVRVQKRSNEQKASQMTSMKLLEDEVLEFEPVEHSKFVLAHETDQVVDFKPKMEESKEEIDEEDPLQYSEINDQLKTEADNSKNTKSSRTIKASVKRRRDSLDWMQMLIYGVAGILLIATVIGLIYAPVITMSVLVTLLVVIIVAIAIAIICVFAAIIGAIFDLL